MPTVSVIINTLNRAQQLETALRALRFQRCERFEVVVVNGPSSDDTASVIERFADFIVSVSCSDPNLARSRNIGIAASHGDIIAFLDDDAIPEPDWLQMLIAQYEDPRVGAVGGFLRDRTGTQWQARYIIADRAGDIAVRPTITPQEVEELDRSTQHLLVPTGANCSFRRIALLEVNGFDPWFRYHLDETDVLLRLRDAGWLIRITPTAVVHHKFAPNALRDPAGIILSYQQLVRSKTYFILRHYAPKGGIDLARERIAGYAAENIGRFLWSADQRGISTTMVEAQARVIQEGVDEAARAAGDAIDVSDRPTPALAANAAALIRFHITQPPAKRLRIAMISREYPPSPVGGIGRWTYIVARGLASRGHEVSVITVSPTGQAVVDYLDDVWIHRISDRNAGTPAAYASSILPRDLAKHASATYTETRSIILRRGLDLVSAPIWDLEGAELMHANMLPVVTSLHTTDALSSARKGEHGLTDINDRKETISRAEKEVLCRSRFILANSTAIVGDIDATYGITLARDRVSVVPHGVPRGLDEQQIGAKLANVDSDDTAVRLLFVGRLEPRKGVDILADALRRIASSATPKVRLEIDIAGMPQPQLWTPSEWKKIATIEALGTSRIKVRLHGEVDDNSLAALYTDADIVVIPSRYESFGLVAAEAMSFACAVIATDVGGFRDIVDDGKTGTLIPAGDAEALASAILTIGSAPGLRQRLARAGYGRYRSKFSEEEMISRLEEYYFSVIAT